MHRFPRRAAVAAAALLSVSLAGCGLNASHEQKVEASKGSVAASVDLHGVNITAGSKEFTEQRILGRMLIEVLSAAGAKVKDQTGLVGSTARTALESGKIDTYYEYTGTGWINILKQTKPVPGAQAQFEAVKKKDAANGVTWLSPPATANNTYAIAANPAMVKKYGVKTISDYAKVVKQHPDDAGLCTAPEFPQREDGLPGMEKAYGFKLPASKVATMDFGLVYVRVSKGDPCNFAVVFGTDGQVLANHLTVLKDDKQYFPVYNIALTMRTPVYQAHKNAYDKLFGKINPLLTNQQMLKLNAAVDVQGQDVNTVVDKFLKDHHII